MICSRICRYAGLLLLALVIAIGPFLQGLFFWTPLLGAISVILLGFSLWFSGRGLGNLPVSLTGDLSSWALLALLSAYVIQFAWAAFPRGNIDWVLRVLCAWVAYVQVRSETGPALRRCLGWLLVGTGSVLALAGFLEFSGYFAANPDMMAALGLISMNNRMATALQYPNTGAVFLMAALTTAIGLALEDLRPWKLGLSTGLSTLLSLAFAFTGSRGALVVLPLCLVMFFMGLEKEKRWPAFLMLAVAWGPVVIALKGVGTNAAIHNHISAFRWITAACVSGSVGGAVLGFFLRLSRWKQVLTISGVLVLVIAGLVVVQPTSTVLPRQAARFLDFSLADGSIAYRLTADRDGTRIVADQPLGRGGWGWERSYRRYQETYYIGRDAHNHYVQTAVEAGLPGMLALITGIAGGGLSAWRNRRNNVVGWSLATGAIVIAAHSFIDFDLSFGAVWLLLWCLLAAAGEPTPQVHLKISAVWSGAAAVACIALFTGTLAVGSWYADQAESLQALGQREAAAAAATQSTQFDPWNSAPLLVLGDQASLERAVRFDPYQSRLHFDLAILLENRADHEGAIREAREAVRNGPLLTANYSKLASIAGNLMVDALHTGDLVRTRQLAQELVELGEDFFRRQEAEPQSGPWAESRLTMSAVFKLRYGQALFLFGETKRAEAFLVEASKVGLLGSEADVWLYAIYEERLDKQAMASLENKPWIRFRSANPVYKIIRTLSFSHEPL